MVTLTNICHDNAEYFFRPGVETLGSRDNRGRTEAFLGRRLEAENDEFGHNLLSILNCPE